MTAEEVMMKILMVLLIKCKRNLRSEQISMKNQQTRSMGSVLSKDFRVSRNCTFKVQSER